MVKIEIKIEEKIKKYYETISTSVVEVEKTEMEIKPTKNEKEVAEILKKRIGTNNEIINKSKRKQANELKEFLENLLSI